jgi:hypothetical protein
MYRPALRNCITLFPSRASCAQRDAVSGFCSRPRNGWSSNRKSTSRNRDRLVRCTGKLMPLTVIALDSSTKAWRHTEIRFSSKVAAIVSLPDKMIRAPMYSLFIRYFSTWIQSGARPPMCGLGCELHTHAELMRRQDSLGDSSRSLKSHRDSDGIPRSARSALPAPPNAYPQSLR